MENDTITTVPIDDKAYKATVYAAANDVSATLSRKNIYDGDTVLTLRDKDETIKTGFLPQASANATGGAFTLEMNLGSKDTLRCVDGRSDVISRDVENAIVSERMQEFAGKHPELAAKLREVALPIASKEANAGTDYDVTIAQMLDMPAQFRACPITGEDKDAVVKTHAR